MIASVTSWYIENSLGNYIEKIAHLLRIPTDSEDFIVLTKQRDVMWCLSYVTGRNLTKTNSEFLKQYWL